MTNSTTRTVNFAAALASIAAALLPSSTSAFWNTPPPSATTAMPVYARAWRAMSRTIAITVAWKRAARSGPKASASASS